MPDPELLTLAVLHGIVPKNFGMMPFLVYQGKAFLSSGRWIDDPIPDWNSTCWDKEHIRLLREWETQGCPLP